MDIPLPEPHLSLNEAKILLRYHYDALIKHMIGLWELISTHPTLDDDPEFEQLIKEFEQLMNELEAKYVAAKRGQSSRTNS